MKINLYDPSILHESLHLLLLFPKEQLKRSKKGQKALLWWLSKRSFFLSFSDKTTVIRNHKNAGEYNKDLRLVIGVVAAVFLWWTTCALRRWENAINWCLLRYLAQTRWPNYRLNSQLGQRKTGIMVLYSGRERGFMGERKRERERDARAIKGSYDQRPENEMKSRQQKK